mmetsp:Transcript_13747/g.40502  ORF Transcript_13747/g.40502 Transcript_13747/m.40502 type:complete len:208 (+) Transcript_13747:226-849(+)
MSPQPPPELVATRFRPRDSEFQPSFDSSPAAAIVPVCRSVSPALDRQAIIPGPCSRAIVRLVELSVVLVRHGPLPHLLVGPVLEPVTHAREPQQGRDPHAAASAGEVERDERQHDEEGRVRLARGLLEGLHHVDAHAHRYGECRRGVPEEHGPKEADVMCGDARPSPRAMVVELKEASVAGGAVLGPGWAPEIAVPAPSELNLRAVS